MGVLLLPQPRVTARLRLVSRMREMVLMGISCLLRWFVQRIGADENFLGSLGPFAPDNVEITLIPKPQKLHAFIVIQGELDSGHSGVVVKGGQMLMNGLGGPLEELIQPLA